MTGNKVNNPLFYETPPLKEQQLAHVLLEAESRCSNRDLYKGTHTVVKGKVSHGEQGHGSLQQKLYIRSKMIKTDSGNPLNKISINSETT